MFVLAAPWQSSAPLCGAITHFVIVIFATSGRCSSCISAGLPACCVKGFSFDFICDGYLLKVTVYSITTPTGFVFGSEKTPVSRVLRGQTSHRQPRPSPSKLSGCRGQFHAARRPRQVKVVARAVDGALCQRGTAALTFPASLQLRT